MENSDEKRSELRLLSQVAVFLELEPSPQRNTSGKICVTNTIDVSANGIQIISDFALPIHSIHTLYIEIADLNFNVVAEVMWMTPKGEQFAIGFQLIESQHTDIESWKTYICQQLST